MIGHVVSIIVPCYNQANYLAETLDSVLAQTYQNWECVIVNDGSPDNTEEIAQRYLEKDKRFVYVCQENQGVASARNKGIQTSCGEFILPLDSDDIILPSYIEKAVNHFVQFPNTKLVYSKAYLFGEINQQWGLEKFDYDKFIWNNCVFCTAMFRRADYDQTNGYNKNMVYGYEDWDFWLSLIRKGDSVYRIEETLFYYRRKNKSRSIELERINKENALIQLYNNHIDIYDSFINENRDRIVCIYQELLNGKVLEEENRVLKQEIRRILNSKSYRLGKLLLKPLSRIKNGKRL